MQGAWRCTGETVGTHGGGVQGRGWESRLVRGTAGVSEGRCEGAGAGLAGRTCSQASLGLELGLWRQSAGI